MKTGEIQTQQLWTHELQEGRQNVQGRVTVEMESSKQVSSVITVPRTRPQGQMHAAQIAKKHTAVMEYKILERRVTPAVSSIAQMDVSLWKSVEQLKILSSHLEHRHVQTVPVIVKALYCET